MVGLEPEQRDRLGDVKHSRGQRGDEQCDQHLPKQWQIGRRNDFVDQQAKCDRGDHAQQADEQADPEQPLRVAPAGPDGPLRSLRKTSTGG